MNREDYQWFRAHNICVRCQSAAAFVNHIYCADCIPISNEIHRRWQKKNPEKVRQASKSWYARMKREGRCVRCGRENPDAGIYASCPWCRGKERERWQYRHVAKPPGLCRYCDRPAMPGKKTCTEHYAWKVAVMMQNRYTKAQDEGMVKTGRGRNIRDEEGAQPNNLP